MAKAKKTQWRKYRWSELFRDRQRRFVLLRGRDYHCSQAAIVQQARNYASANGYKVSVVDGENRVTVVIVESPEGSDEAVVVEA